MKQYTNAVAGITINVTEIRGQRIQYVGVGAPGYQGYLDYDLAPDAFQVRTMTAQPQGSGLGALLLFEASLIAPRYGKSRVDALTVAPTARGFYLKLRFHPSRTEAQNIDIHNMANNFGERLRLGRNIATWQADRNKLQQAAAAQIRAKGWA